MTTGSGAIVSYCDYFMEWDYPAYKRGLQDSGIDGNIVCYTGYHPHHVHEGNFYDYVQLDKAGFVEAVSPKRPFTSDKLAEPASTGTYYYRTGQILKEYSARALAIPELSTHGEHYMPVLYPLMAKDGLKSTVSYVKRFMQWGTPQDLAEYEAWEKYFRQVKAGQSPKLPFADMLARDYWAPYLLQK